ncbi:MAG: BamA/TamA family outer membrane protein [Candidatus Poribacteria bacterium]|nr:BamA/TamA family outer membrane protein [Candidatus Poribacteria bacterium]
MNTLKNTISKNTIANMKVPVFFLCLGLTMLISSSVLAQGFGKNKITAKRFDWHIHRTEHFDIHYYPSEAKLVPIMAAIAEDAYEKHSEDFEHELEGRTPLILYKSHKDFQETNVILQELHEGIGGFAELFKHRIVIPFTGSLEAFREVIFHELIHIFQYDIIYQKPHASIYSGEFLYSPPIWFMEGMADYFAEDNDAIGEMVLRDASMNNNIVPLTELQNFNRLSSPYVGYKMGQLAVGYLVQTYGREKIAEIMQGLRQSKRKNLDLVFKNVLGVSLKEFNTGYQQMVRKRYWPLIEDRELPDIVAKKLTEESKFSHNIKPVWSPSGDIIAYITGNEGFLEIVLMSAKTGQKLDRITKRYFREKYEEIRTDSSGFDQSLAWAPDGDHIVFIGKHHDNNYLLEVNILTHKLTHYVKLDFDNATSPNYDSAGKRIVFSALKEGQTDLYIIELETETISQLTRDPFNDTHPSWHPTKNTIVYASEREGKNRLVLVDIDQQTKQILTEQSSNAISPVWMPDGESVLFCADRTGVFDAYKLHLAHMQVTRLTNFMTGCFNPSFSPDEKRFLFSAYQNGKYDVCVMESANILDQKIETPPLETQPIPFTLDSDTSEPNYRIAKRKYSTRSSFRFDAIFPQFTYGADGLFRSQVQMSASDMLGNHRVEVSVINQSGGYLLPDFIAQYGFLTHRADVGAVIYNYHQYHLLGSIRNQRGILQRVTGLGGYLSYPFDRYNRLDLQYSMYTTPFSYNFQTSEPFNYYERGLLSLGSIAFVSDNTMWREWAPYRGTRYRFEVERSFPAIGSQLALTNAVFDFRNYFGLGRRSTIATRLLLGGSFGNDKSLFYLGGIDTLRGYNYEDFVGSRIGLFSVELRIPFIDALYFGWPIRWAIGGIGGVLFADFGGTWADWQYDSDNPFQALRRDGSRIRLEDIKGSVGVGLRLKLGLFSIDFAAARHTDLASIKPGFKYQFGLGQAF